MRSSGRRWIALALVIILTGMALWNTGCSKDVNNPPPPTTGTVSGRVIDASTSTPISGATVSSGSAQVTTGADGLFTLTLPSGTATITVKHAGFTLNQLVVTVPAGSVKQATVGLLAVGAAEPVTVAAGGSVTDPLSNAVISLPPGFVTAAGSVTVSITGLDPTTSDIRALPGGLDAVDANGNAVYLNPVSFAEYTVTDAAGNVLPYNASAGAGADIELPIPASLRGKPGYGFGDPIECYLYDPADGKWKTPVPGVIGPSSVDGSPAIKATIFHLSWYGGAPASNDITCIDGYVKNANGTPAAGIGVEAFSGSSSTTDAQGYYRVNAAPYSTVRVVATKVNGTNIEAGEVEIHTGAAGTSCSRAPDITLHAGPQGTYHVLAILVDGAVVDAGGQPITAIGLVIQLESSGFFVDVADAKVEVNGGTSWATVPFVTSGADSGIYALHSPSAGFTITAGNTYSLRIDYDRNGTIDATGQIQMTGVPVNTYPPNSGTVGKRFTATWSDPASAVPNYDATYWLQIYGPEYRDYLTSSRSYEVGNGVPDSSVYGYPMPNDSLSAGSYEMAVWSFQGPLFFGLPGPYYPSNISGQDTDGYFASYGAGYPTTFTSTGVAPRAAAGRRPGISRAGRPSGPTLSPQVLRLLDRLKHSAGRPQRVARAR